MSRSVKYWLWGITAVSFLIRLPSVFVNNFHADEALYASFARSIAVWRDPLLLTQPVDKPPALFYFQALFFPLFGPVEWVARLPNLIASLLLVPLIGVLVWHLIAEEKAVITSSAIFALTPLSVQFSATAFTDPLLTFFLFTTILALVLFNPESDDRHRAANLSGMAFGLAGATKYQAWLFLPLIIGLMQLRGWGWKDRRQWLVGFLPIVLLTLIWVMARSISGNIFVLQLANFGGLRPIWSWELAPRLWDWIDLWMDAWGSMWVGALAVILVGAGGYRTRQRHSKHGRLVALLLLFCSVYLLLHWILAIPIWDRYLLPIWPLLAVLIGIHISKMSERISLIGNVFATSLLIVLLLPSAWQARNGRYPIGGQPGADQGAALVAQTLASEPYGTVLYDHWYSWHWRYHFFDGQIYPSWFQSPDTLVQELLVFGSDGNRHYLALPDAAVSNPVNRAVTEAGFELRSVTIEGNSQILLYEIIPKLNR